nr:immunoglobulin heavy chain junction region [Mus musculus]
CARDYGPLYYAMDYW